MRSVDWEKAASSQETSFDVRYQPISELAFELPLGWSIVNDQIEVVSDDAVAPQLMASIVVEPETHGRLTRIAGGRAPAQPRLGKFRVRTEYVFDEEVGQADVRASYLKLPRPVASHVSTHRVEVAAAKNVSVSAAASPETPWQSELSTGANPVFVISGNGANDELPLQVGPFASVVPAGDRRGPRLAASLAGGDP